jgi:alpha-methylacyl-CoA racemase
VSVVGGAHGALTGVHVVSIAVNVPGPVAASRLARLGARVTKVEPPTGDPLSRYSPSWYDELRRGIDVETLDLRSAPGRERLEVLLAAADVFITSSRPSSLARLGLEPRGVAARHAHLCQVAIVGHAEPDQEQSGHDLTYQVASGVLRPPELPRVLVADLAGAERVVTAALALLMERTTTGRGGRADVALAEAARDFAVPVRVGLTSAGGVLGGSHPGYAWYRASDGWVAVAALEPRFAECLAALVAPKTCDSTALSEVFATRNCVAWNAWAKEEDMPLVAVRDESS